MPSISHEGPIDVIRKNKDMTADLVERVTPIKLPDRGTIRVELGSTDASNVVPDQFKADMVTVIYDKATAKPLLIVIIEPQGREDSTKRLSWPAYIANLRAAHDCERAVLIVICWDEAEADKCRKAIEMGHPGYVLVPIVIDPRSGPDLANAGPWLTILSAAMRALRLDTDASRRTVLDAIKDTSSDTPTHRTLTTIILAIAPPEHRAELEALMQTAEYKSDFLDRIEARGEARGKVRGEAEALLVVFQSRGIELTSDQRDTVTNCTDAGQLEKWITRAITATSADEVFKD
jgi:hypothetical protein